MNAEIVKFIFLFLIGTTLLNFTIALLARIKTGHKEFNVLIYYWISILLTFGAAAALNNNPTQIGFAFFFQIISTYIMTSFLSEVRELDVKVSRLAVVYFIAATISAFLLIATNVGFTISLLPVVTAIAYAYLGPTWDVLVKNRKTAHWTEKALGWVFVSCIVNCYTYAFYRLDESTAWWGWSVSIAQYQSISIFLFLLVNNHREKNEKKNLQFALERISGQNSNFNIEVEELYRQLELQISLKQDFHERLTLANANLEEEQETNELLIRTISHDLASPLTVMNAYLAMLTNGKISEPEEQKKIFARMKNNIDSAGDMIERIRKAIVSRNQASLVNLRDVPVDQVVSTLLETYETRLRAKEIQVKYENPFPGVMFRADKNALLEHVLSNIMSNAIKFSFPESVISIKIRSDGETVFLSIRDFGLGIDESRLGKRLLSSTKGTSGETGSGFGIMVMGYFMRKFEGSFQIQSKTSGEDQGTTVTIALKKSTSVTSTPITRVQPASIYSQSAH